MGPHVETTFRKYFDHNALKNKSNHSKPVTRKGVHQRKRKPSDVTIDNMQTANEGDIIGDNIDDGEPQVRNNFLSRCMQALWDSLDRAILKHRKTIHVLMIIVLNGLVLTYFGFATAYWIKNDKGRCNFEWCDGYGMLLVLIILIYLGLFYYLIFKRYIWPVFRKSLGPLIEAVEKFTSLRWVPPLTMALVFAAVFIFIIVDIGGSWIQIQPLSGILILNFLGFFFSKYPGQIDWRPVLSGLIAQVLLALLTIRWSVGREIFRCTGDKISTFLKFADAGSSFVYSDHLVFEKPVFAFQALSIIFFFSFTISILFYLGILQWVLLKLGWWLQIIVGTTVCESVVAGANIFIGMTEAPLIIKPYIDILTKSELHSIVTSGFATVSGTVLAAYISFGAEPAHLLTASVMSAPAALSYSKLFYPETEKSKTASGTMQMAEPTDSSLLDAATNGATTAIGIILGVIANIVAFVGCVAFLNGLVGYFSMLVGFPGLTFEQIFGYLFMPLSWIMGVPWDECEYVGRLVGLKTVINEFAAYQRLGVYKKAGVLSRRSLVIATYAVCGFANPASVGIVIAVLGALSPSRKQDITSVAMRALIAGNAVCFLTACIAGLLIREDTFHRSASPQNMTVF